MPELSFSYDERGDVLYLTVGSPDPHARSRSDEHGFIWRTSKDGVRRAVTIENARAWLKKKSELEKLLADGFGVERKIVHKEIREFA
jgi:uncharacterized protein YuzE